MKKIALLAGGNSGEFEISIKTANNIINQLDTALFEVFLIIIQNNKWTYSDKNQQQFEVNKDDFTLTINDTRIVFDVAFIAIHGDPGENGKLQAYFELLKIKYTGCDSFCSALTFNKYFCNIAVEKCGVIISPSLHYYFNEKINYEEVVGKIGLPCFVKPCNSGSSVGVTKAHNYEELIDAVKLAFEVDYQLMIEKFIKGRELTCGVTKWNGDVMALAVTEIISKKEYYDFEAKYTPGFLEMVTPAKISTSLEEKIKEQSIIIFQRLGCKGVVRIDFIVTEEETPIFLEINTIPGQTAMSIIPKQLIHNNISLKEFYAAMING